MKQKRGKNHKGQQSIGMSFGTIFSIFLIIFFVVIAFFVIRYFLGLQKCTQVAMFLDDFQEEIDTAWNSERSEFQFNPNLPGNLEFVCFANLSKVKRGSVSSDVWSDIELYEDIGANLFLYPTINACEVPYDTLKNIDLNDITSSENPYCVEIIDGKVLLNIEKNRGERLVKIS